LVRLVSAGGLGAGVGSDVFARAVVEIVEREKLIEQPLRVVNRTASASLQAMEYLAQRKGDAHTIAIFFARLAKTPGWKRYVEENQVADVFMRGADMPAFLDDQIEVMRRVLREAGVAVVQ
jgi:tripartite-type tricarboxylate transporter receptor subunit TctC